MPDFVKKGQKELPLKSIIMEAGVNFGMMIQWSRHLEWLPTQTEHFYFAKCLVEIAETMVCGSVGGFDVVKVGKKTIYQETRGEEEFFSERKWSEHGKYDNLFERWLWLFTFYTDGTDKSFLGTDGWYKVADLKKFFIKK